MRLIRSGGGQRGGDRVYRLAVGAWIAFVTVICVRCAIWPRVHSVYPIYAQAGVHWLEGSSVYLPKDGPEVDQYRYSPFVVLPFVLLQNLPDELGGILMRLGSVTVFILGLHWWLSRGIPHLLSRRQKSLILLMSIPIVMSSLSNGQLNVLIIGLLAAAVTATVESRWWLAGGCLAGAMAIKLYPLAMAMLLLIFYWRRLAVPLLVCLSVVLAAPFLSQSWNYVLGQYAEWCRVLAQDDRKFLPPEAMYRDLWLLLRDAGVPLSSGVYLMIQLSLAAFCAALCLCARWNKWPARACATLTLSLGSCWILLCGPATEPCTYAMLAPVLCCLAVIVPRVEAWPRSVCYLPLLAYGAFFLWTFTGALPGETRFVTRHVAPLATLLLMAGQMLATLSKLCISVRRFSEPAALGRAA